MLALGEEDMTRKQHLCWGLIFHMLGLNTKSKELLSKIEDARTDPFPALSQVVIEYSDFQAGLGKLKGATATPQTQEGRANPSRLLRELVRHVGDILDPPSGSASMLARENSVVTNQDGVSHCTIEGPVDGYSRDPFKIIKADDIDDISLGAICYLLRGYSSFFCRTRSKRDFNAAKTALNDFY